MPKVNLCHYTQLQAEGTGIEASLPSYYPQQMFLRNAPDLSFLKTPARKAQE